MINSSISFGKQIPLTSCIIQDKATGRKVPVTLYELDCTDATDVIKILQIKNKWKFAKNMLPKMYSRYNENIGNSTNTRKSKFSEDNKHFYTLELDNGKIVGIAQTYQRMFATNVDYIETLHDKYKYAGQSMLASLGIIGMKSRKNTMTIESFVKKAVPFYTEKCGFKSNSFTLMMDKPDMKRLIKKVEKETNSSIVDLNA